MDRFKLWFEQGPCEGLQDAHDAIILEGSALALERMVLYGKLWGRFAEQAEALAADCRREAVRLTARRLEQTP